MPKKEKKYNEKVAPIIAMAVFVILVVASVRGLDEGLEYSE